MISQITSPALLQTIGISYLLGSIPFGYLLVRMFLGQDVRQSGSGNTGATNVSRSNKRLGVLTLLLDALKGMAAVAVAHKLFPSLPDLMFVAGFMAVLGHMFSVWLAFQGGKGVATGLGAFVLLAPKAMLVAAIVFLALFQITRYVSLASICAVTVFPIAVYLLGPREQGPFSLVLMAAVALLIVLRHRANIRRLLQGAESRFGRAHT